MNGLDLFSGIGGISLALSEWVKPIAYCERDPFCNAVLLSRMRDGSLRSAPIWDDIKTLRSTMLPRLGGIDIIYGGFPCQDISVAGTGKELEGERSGLFFQIIRLVSEIRPSFVFLENVPAIVVRGLNRVLLELASLGYDCRWTIVSAAEMGAVHIRERWFLLAYSDCNGLREERWSEVRRANSKRTGQVEFDCAREERRITRASKGKVEPRVHRTGDGVSFPVDRNRGIGNAVVPDQAQEAFKRLMGIK